MATNPLLILQGQTPTTRFSNVLTNIQNIESIKQQQAQAPARNQLLQAQADITQSQVPGDISQFNKEQKAFTASVADISRQIVPDLQSGNIDSAIKKLQSRAEQLKASGISDENTQRAIALAQSNPQELLKNSMLAIELDNRLNPQRQANIQFGAQQTFKDEQGNLFFGTTRRNPNSGQVESALTPITGNAQPQGQVELVSGLGQTAQERQATTVQTAQQVEAVKLGEQLETKPKITGAEEREKLKAQKGLLPEVKAAVATALDQAKAIADRAGTIRSNETALNVYDTAMKGLTTAFSETETGPVIGLIPAITANQQIADGAVAAMAPVLKQLFRSAGEGIFTDKDQELLLRMVPTRTDLQEARVSKISNIDAIVRAKLTVPDVQQAEPQQPSTFTSSGGVQFTVE